MSSKSRPSEWFRQQLTYVGVINWGIYWHELATMAPTSVKYENRLSTERNIKTAPQKVKWKKLYIILKTIIIVFFYLIRKEITTRAVKEAMIPNTRTPLTAPIVRWLNKIRKCHLHNFQSCMSFQKREGIIPPCRRE